MELQKGQGNFWSDGYAYYLAGGAAFMGMYMHIYVCVCVCVQTHQIVYFTYVQFFVYQLYLNKAVSGGIVKLLCIPEKICKVSNISVRPDA